MFLCPVCGKPLDNDPKSRRCPAGHCFDRSAQGGYVNLLRTNRRGSAEPGDNPEMCRARTRFLEQGYYSSLRDAVSQLARQFPARYILDAGCGEGYYTADVAAALREGGSNAQILGADLSKAALRHAGKACPEGEFAVASLFELPLPNHSVDLVLHLFAPMCEKEFRRVLVKDGILLTAHPGARHLWEMKKILYEHPYPNKETAAKYRGFRWMGRSVVDDEITIRSQEDLQALFQMTPYAWRTAKDASKRLLDLNTLTVRTEFLIDIYRAI